MAKKICSVEGCNKEHHALGYCGSHYRHYKKYGDPINKPIKTKPTICLVDGCNKEVHGLGYCNSHYKNYKRYGTPIKPTVIKPTVCTIDDCNESVYCKGMCQKHYSQHMYHSNKGKERKQKIEYDECIVDGCTIKPCSRYSCYCGKHNKQIREHGHLLGRTIYDKNEIVVDNNNNCAYIVLYNKDGIEIDKAIIDIEDIDLIKDYKWHLDGKGYAETTSSNKKNISLHLLIMNRIGINDGLVVDHINRNRLDNRRCNLRLITLQQNAMNRSIRSDNKVGVSNVYMDRNKYIVEFNGIVYGKFDTLEEAKEIARKISLELYGEYSPYYNNNNDTDTTL